MIVMAMARARQLACAAQSKWNLGQFLTLFASSVRISRLLPLCTPLLSSTNLSLVSLLPHFHVSTLREEVYSMIQETCPKHIRHLHPSISRRARRLECQQSNAFQQLQAATGAYHAGHPGLGAGECKVSRSARSGLGFSPASLNVGEDATDVPYEARFHPHGLPPFHSLLSLLLEDRVSSPFRCQRPGQPPRFPAQLLDHLVACATVPTVRASQGVKRLHGRTALLRPPGQLRQVSRGLLGSTEGMDEILCAHVSKAFHAPLL